MARVTDDRAKEILNDAAKPLADVTILTVRDTWAGKIDRIYTPAKIQEGATQTKTQRRIVPLEERKAAGPEAVTGVLEAVLGSLPRKKTTNLVVSRAIDEANDGTLTLRAGAFAWEL